MLLLSNLMATRGLKNKYASAADPMQTICRPYADPMQLHCNRRRHYRHTHHLYLILCSYCRPCNRTQLKSALIRLQKKRTPIRIFCHIRFLENSH